MTTRRSKARKTADKMATYKAAASKSRRSPVGSRTSPRTRKIVSKASENGSPKTSHKCSVETEVEKEVSSAQNHCNGPQREKMSSPTSQEVTDGGSRNDVTTGRVSPSCCKEGENCNECILREDVIPETPPREPAVRSRKRIVAPLQREILNELEECAVEVDKPTKKRRVFQTPPREEGNATAPGFSETSIEKGNSQTRSFDMSVGSPLGVDGMDEIMDPPLRSQRKKRPIPLSRKFDGPGMSREVRQVSNVRSGFASYTRGGNSCEMAAERSNSDSLSLDMIATSSATLSRMFDRFTNKVSLDIENLRMVHLSEMRKIGDELKNHFSAETRNIEALFEMMSNRVQSGNTVRTGGNMTLRDWEKLLDSLTPYATVIFGKELFSRILSFNAPLKAVDTYGKYEGCGISDVERASLSVQTLLFRLQPSDKKFQYLEDVGKLHSDFKFSVVRNAFFNVGIDSFGLFKAESRSREHTEKEIGSDGKLKARERLSRPSWLAEGNITLDHISQARAFTETSGQSRKEKIRRTPSPHDIACHGALRVYRQLSKILHDGRGNMRIAFFQGLGYVLLPWKGRTGDVDQRTMKLSFPEEDHSSDTNLSLSLDEVPFTTQCPQNADANTVSMADAANKKTLRDLFLQWRSMVLSVDHDVIVTKGGQHKTEQSEKRNLHRFIHLIDVALDCCVEFCRTGSRESFLRANKNALKCVMVLALLFKAICVEFLDMWEESASSAAPTIPEPTDVKVYGTCLKDLIPGLVTQKTIMAQKCIHLPLSVFETLHHRSVDDEIVDELEMPGSMFDVRKIEENAEDGICPI